MRTRLLLATALLPLPLLAQNYIELGRNDSDAIPVYQGKETPLLQGRVRAAYADIPVRGKLIHEEYMYIHLDKPINFAAYATKDNFSTSQNHVYDISLSSQNKRIQENIKNAAGKRISVRGMLMNIPTGDAPVPLHMEVEEFKTEK